MKSFKQGLYKPINTDKVINITNKQNKGLLIYRSSWELKFFKFLDLNPSVTRWSSEPFGIKYFNSIKKRECRYYPDFYMQYNSVDFLVEIKPNSQCPGSKARSVYDSVSQIINESKWKAAQDFCEINNMKFVILGDDFFRTSKN